MTDRCACDESLRLLERTQEELCDDCGAPSDHNHADWCPQAAPFACPGCYAGPEDTCADWCAAAAKELLAETDDAGDVHGYT
jgi:hypothetical protein